ADPAGADYYDEFIELYNCGDSAIALNGWYLKINDYADTLSFVPDYGDTLRPHGFAVIMDQGYLVDNQSSTYEDLIPDSALLVTIHDKSFSSNCLKNSAASQIYLFNAQGDTISAVLTTAKPLSGYSWEKIISDGDNQISNWGNSRNLRGTPGFLNSLAPRDRDVAVSGLKQISPVGRVAWNEPVEFEFAVKNVGLQIAEDVRILFGTDHDSDEQIDAILFEETLTLPPGDSVVKNVTSPGFTSGSHSMLARVIFAADEIAENDVDSLELDIAFPSNCLIINEFMYCPATDGGGEWVELFNISDDTLNLKNWTITDNNSDARLTDRNFYLPPQDYLVLVNDSTTFKNYWGKAARLLDCQEAVPVLNNTKDSIVIRDHCRNTIDALGYFSSWGYRQGTSLERKNPFAPANRARNWALSTDEEKATPGRENSVVLRNFDLAIDSVTVVQNDMPIVHGSPVSLVVYVRNNGIELVQQFVVSLTITNPVFGLISDTMISVNSVLAADETQAIGVNCDAVPGGLHSITAEVGLPADEKTDNDTARCNLRIGYANQALIINEIMYMPASGEPEWFEIYNPQSYPVDLNDWSFRNGKGNWIKLADSAIGLAAKGFAVVAENPEFLTIFPDFDGVLIVPSRFPSLKNTADSLFLSDAAGSLIETVFYKVEWGGGSGISIERRNPYHMAAEQTNWSSSRAVAGSTPGAINSNLIKEYDLTLQKIILQPVNEPLIAGEPVLCEITIVNTGLNKVNGFALAVQLNKKIDQQTTVSFFDTMITVLTSIQVEDSVKLSVTFSPVYGGVFDLAARIICAPDADNTNNFQDLALKIGYPPGVVVINEIMFAPLTGQSEWFEIYNNSENPVDLNQWKFRDALGSRVALADSFITLNADEFAVVVARRDFASDYPDFKQTLIVPKSFPTLNNASDSLFVYDAIGQAIDSICYRESWGSGTGISLERLDPDQPALTANNWNGSLQMATPGQINSVIKLENDLAIVPASFQFTDTLAAAGMAAEFSFIVKNKGRNPAESFLVKIYADRNRDGSGQDDELCWTKIFLDSLVPDSSLRATGRITAEKSGQNMYLTEIEWNKDDDPADNLTNANLIVAFPSGCITLNEFLPYPVSDQVEFVECINIGGVTIDLSGWSLGNRNSQTDLPAVEIPAGDYVVFSGDSACFNFFQTTDAAIVIPGKWPGLNNSADQIWLKDLTGKIIDSLGYGAGWPVKAGFSAEKILPELAGIESESWTYSVNSEHQTAGYLNSVTRPENDLCLDSLRFSAITGDTTTVFNVRFFITNTGQNRSCDANLDVTLMNGLAAGIVTHIPLECLNVGQADSGAFQIGPLASGKYDLVVRVMGQSDQVASNDSAAQTIQIAWPEAALLLSEFMPYPYEIRTASSSIAEYLEIYNPGQIEIDLADWLISDQNTAIRRRVPAGFCLPAGEYFVIAGDSSVFTFPELLTSQTLVLDNFPSLNNSEDALYLYDPTGRTIDSLLYDATWNIRQGVAMERISFGISNRATNWRASVARSGGTPGKVNSVALNQPLNKAGIEMTTAVFSPDGDGRDDEIGVRYQLPYPSAKITLEVYDLVGRLIYRPAKNLATAA
ncbi:MAG: lamin tail domain-containing protein, partial [Candidatus Neomarinimicrobiota bacterium]